MRLFAATLFAVLALASPAFATPVTNVTIDNTSPSRASGARTVYAVSFKTSGSGGLTQAANSRINVAFPSGTGFTGFVGATVFDVTRNVAVGSCSSSGALTMQCSLFTSQFITALDTVQIAFRGLTNGAVQGAHHVTVTTTADVDPVDSPEFSVTAAGALSEITATNASPSAAAGARTRYLARFQTSSTGGLAEAANSRIDVRFPAGTGYGGWTGGAIRDVGRDVTVGSCSSPSNDAVECTLFTSQFVLANSTVELTLNGVTNPAAAGDQQLRIATTSDPALTASPAFAVTAPNRLSAVTLTNANPSSGAGARTNYVAGFTASSTGALSQDANSRVAVTFPTGTTFGGWTGGTIRDLTRGLDVGSCSSPIGLSVECTFFTDQFVNAGDRVELTLRGVTNPATAGADKTATLSTTSDHSPVSSPPFSVLLAGALSGVTVDNTAPSRGAGARTRYVVGFTTSATGGLSQAANSRILATFPAGTTFTGWTGGTIHDVARNADVGSCSSPIGLTIECTFFTGQFANASAEVRITFNGVTNPVAAGTDKTLALSTTSDPQSTASAPFSVVAGAALTNVAVTVASLAASAGTGYVVRARASSTGGLSQQANSRITVTFEAGTTFPGFSGGAIHDVTRGVNVGSCSSPIGLTVDCSLFTGQFVAAGDSVQISFASVTNPAAAPPYQLTVATTSDTPATTSTAYMQGDITAPDTTIDIGPSSPTPATVVAFSFSSEAGTSFECRLDSAAFATCSSPYMTPALGNGEHTFLVRATDAGGNPDATPASRTFNVQATVPAAPVIAAPAPGATVGSSTVTVSGSGETGSTVSVLEGATTLGSATVSGGVWTVPVAGVSEGAHTYTARASNLAGTGATATRTFQVKLLPPETTILSGPTGPANATTFTFGTDSGTSFECSLSGAGFEPCVSPKTYALSEGDYSFAVRALDAAGSPDATPATRSFSVDATAPDAPVITSPAENARLSSATVVVTGSAERGSTVSVREGATARGSALAADGTWTVTVAGAGNGAHTYEARASDAAGNTSAATSRTVFVDVAEPPTPTPTAVATTAPVPVPTPSATPAPAPEFKKDVVVAPVSGTIEVCDKPGVNCRKLAAGAEIPLNSTVDARKGAVELSSITAGGVVQKAKFYDGMFKVTQSAATTDLTLNEPLAPCGKKARAAAKKPKSRRLWGDGQGKFRTRGQYSAATIRGTRWLVQDSCAGTLTQVKQGVVSVRDEVKNKTLTLRAGKSYTAKPRR